eukprot:7050-Pelagococcus_subviridis.AAC.6
MRHRETMRLHRVIVPIVRRPNVRVVEVGDAVLARRHDARSRRFARAPSPPRVASRARCARNDAGESERWRSGRGARVDLIDVVGLRDSFTRRVARVSVGTSVGFHCARYVPTVLPLR